MHLFNSCTFCFSVIISLQPVQAFHIDWSRHVDNGGAFPILSRFRDNVIQLFFGEPPASWAQTRNRDYFARRNPYYHGKAVLRFNTTTEEETKALDEWVDTCFLDIWDRSPTHMDIMLSPKRLTSPPRLNGLPGRSGILDLLPKHLQERGFTYVIRDLAPAVAKTFPSDKYTHQYQLPASSITETRPETGKREDINNVFFQEYQPLAVIVRWMKLLESMFGGLAEVITVGSTSEGRKIHGMRLRSEKGRRYRTKRTVLITGGFHAREWISTSTVTYLIWSLLTEYKSDGIATKFLNNFDVVLIPSMNPDGYEYTWQEDRLWRKNRQDTIAAIFRECKGVDLDHSFGYQWKYEEHRQDPCLESYGGEKAFDAIETASFADWAKNETEKNSVKFVSYIDLHSYSQQILYPFSYNCDKTPANLENMEEVAFGLSKAIRVETGQLYTIASACGEVELEGRVGNWSRVLPYSGSAIDWFHHEMKTKFTYQIKLGDTGSYGFLLPSGEIVPTGNEVYEAFKYFADFLMGHNGIEKPHKAASAKAAGSKPSDADAHEHERQELKKREPSPAAEEADTQKGYEQAEK